MLQSIHIANLSLSSAIGQSRDAVDLAVAQGRGALSKAHPFGRSTKSPLAVIAEPSHAGPEMVEGIPPYSDRLFKLLKNDFAELVGEADVYRRYQPRRVGFFLGTTTAGLSQTIAAINAVKKATDGADTNENWPLMGQAMAKQLFRGNLFESLEAEFPLLGPRAMLSTACSSGALAIREGAQAILSGQIDACIVGGYDVLTEVTIAGFSSLQVIDQEFCRPFTQGRAGLNLGEGGALFLLEREENLHRPSLAKLRGIGVATDNFHQTRPAPDGGPMEAAMRQAIDQLSEDELNSIYINAHGTGTEANDAAEAAAIERIFGEVIAYESTKRLHGHCLGGAGALELAITLGVLKREMPNSAQGRIGLSNSFGFGGSCVSVAVESLERGSAHV